MPTLKIMIAKDQRKTYNQLKILLNTQHTMCAAMHRVLAACMKSVNNRRFCLSHSLWNSCACNSIACFMEECLRFLIMMIIFSSLASWRQIYIKLFFWKKKLCCIWWDRRKDEMVWWHGKRSKSLGITNEKYWMRNSQWKLEKKLLIKIGTNNRRGKWPAAYLLGDDVKREMPSIIQYAYRIFAGHPLLLVWVHNRMWY